MSVIPLSRLSMSDLLALGNNLAPRRRHRSPLAAINRSLAVHSEQVHRLHTPRQRREKSLETRGLTA